MKDPHELQRFVEAQDRVYSRVVTELRAGRKTSHWMWFIFPQIAGLGSSPMAQRYAIRSLAEATAYLEHGVLGTRLRECTELVLAVQNRDISDIFGYPDDLKFHSSMTLFALADGAPPLFNAAIERYFNGEPDVKTLELLGRR
jgi:uncharacterized protein (DUF1810 family)